MISTDTALSALQALIGLPECVVALQGMIASSKSDKQELAFHIFEVRDRLLKFTELHAWLAEAKDLHQLLQAVDIALDDARRHWLELRLHRQRDLNETLEIVLHIWQTTKRHSLILLLAFLRDMSSIDRTVLFEDHWGRRFRVPEQALTIFERTRDIERLVARLNALSPFLAQQQALEREKIAWDIAGHLYSLSDEIKSLMVDADRDISMAARDIGTGLDRLGSGLRS